MNHAATAYYADKTAVLSRIFGGEVTLTEDHVIVGDRRYPVECDVIITLDASRTPWAAGDAAGAEFSASVQQSFGQQWQQFSEVTDEHREEFRQYFDLVEVDRLGDCVVADLGCGSGRYASCIAQYCSSVVLVDFSEAIFVARRNLADQRHAVFIMGDLLTLPVAKGAFDFAYSLGVMHHLPFPVLQALRRLELLSPAFLVYLYYALDNRPFYFRALLRVADGVRLRLVRSDSELLRTSAVWLITLLAYWPMSRLGAALRSTGAHKALPLAEFYAGKSLRRLRQDAHDRFLTGIEQRVTRKEIRELAGQDWQVTVSDELPYWHFLYVRKGTHTASPALSTGSP